jgi:hypothetical protein
MLLLESTSRVTPIRPAAILERWMRALVPLLSTKAVAPTAVTFFLPPAKPRSEERVRYETQTTPVRTSHQITSNDQSISETEKSKMARDSDCSRYHLFDMFYSPVFCGMVAISFFRASLPACGSH